MPAVTLSTEPSRIAYHSSTSFLQSARSDADALAAQRDEMAPAIERRAEHRAVAIERARERGAGVIADEDVLVIPRGDPARVGGSGLDALDVLGQARRDVGGVGPRRWAA